MERAFVTGGTGFIGSRLCHELAGRGVRVLALVRSGSDRSKLAGLPVEFVEGDVTDLSSLRAGMAGCDTVFHMAALYREAKFPDAVYWKVNLDGTRNVLDAAKEVGVRYVSYCSTTGVLGDIKHPPADEATPYAPLDVYQESKTEAEKLVLERLRSGFIAGSVIRPTMVWGPHDTRLFKLFKGIATRSLPIVGDGKTWCHWVLVDDLVRGFRLAAESPYRTSAGLYTVGGERPVTLEHTMRTIAGVYGVKLLPFKVPVAPIQLAGSLVEAACAPFGIEPPLHRRRVDFFVKNRSFDCSKASRDFGYRPTYTFEEEAALTARWYLENGWLKLRHAA